MSLELEISDRAQEDVVRQYAWYAVHASEEIAERYLRAFYDTASRLVSSPSMGRKRKYLMPELDNLRSFRLEDSFDAHLLFYHTDEGMLIVVRVMHGARDLPRRLHE